MMKFFGLDTNNTTLRMMKSVALSTALAVSMIACEDKGEENNKKNITNEVLRLDEMVGLADERVVNLELDAKEALDKKDTYTNTANFIKEYNSLIAEQKRLASEVKRIDNINGGNITASNIALYNQLKKDIINLNSELNEIKTMIDAIDKNNESINENQALADKFLQSYNDLFNTITQLNTEYDKFQADINAGNKVDMSEFAKFYDAYSSAIDSLNNYNETLSDISSLSGIDNEVKDKIDSISQKANGEINSKEDLDKMQAAVAKDLLEEILEFNTAAEKALADVEKINNGEYVEGFDTSYNFLNIANDKQAFLKSSYDDLSFTGNEQLNTAVKKMEGLTFLTKEELEKIQTENKALADKELTLADFSGMTLEEVTGASLNLSPSSNFILLGNDLNNFLQKINALKSISVNGAASGVINTKLQNGTVSLNDLNEVVAKLAENNVAFVNNVNERSSNLVIDPNGKNTLTFEDLKFWDLQNQETMLDESEEFKFVNPNVSFNGNPSIDLEGKSDLNFSLSNILVNFGYELIIDNYVVNSVYVSPKNRPVESLYGLNLLFAPTYFKFNKNTVSFESFAGVSNEVRMVQAGEAASHGYRDDLVLENIVDFMQNTSVGKILMERQEVAIIPGNINADNAGDFFLKYAGKENGFRFKQETLDILARISKDNPDMDKRVGGFTTSASDYKKMVELYPTEYMKLWEIFGDPNTYYNFANTIVKDENIGADDFSLSGTVIFLGDMPAGSRILPRSAVWQSVSGVDEFTQRDPNIVTLGNSGPVSLNTSANPNIYYADNNPRGDGERYDLRDNMNPAGTESYADVEIGGEVRRIYFKIENGSWSIDRNKTDANIFAQ